MVYSVPISRATSSALHSQVLWSNDKARYKVKNSTALSQSKGSVRFLIIVVPCVWRLFFWLRHWTLAVIAAFMSLYLFADAWNVFRIKRACEKDPEFLKKKVPGT